MCMDELEIAGRRYLSTRRAGKEHKYHSDYIGQLIRGGKVVGKKVGRSWYVEEESLNAYLNGEGQKSKGVVKKVAAEPIEEPVVVAVEPEPVIKSEPVLEPIKVSVEEKIIEPIAVQKVEEEHRILINTPKTRQNKSSGLHYIADDAPLLPEIHSKKISKIVSTEIPVYESNYLPSVEELEPGKVGFLSLATLVVIGIISLSLTAVASIAISFETIVEEGQVASAGYTLK